MNSFFEEIYIQIYVTFIYENRWKFFIDGLWMTLLLTFSSFILGTLLGIVFCRLKMSRSVLLRRISDIIASLFIQIPTMVLLMLFVYVIFGSSSLPVVLVVIICLTIKTASYMSDIFYTSVNAVNKGEIEAARTLGMNRYQAFFNVMLPQAIDNVLPVYKNQFVSTLQETSVVGYIAIMDLTRASDIVSSRTFDAMFALITVTLIYLVIGWSVSVLIGVLMKRKHVL